MSLSASCQQLPEGIQPVEHLDGLQGACRSARCCCRCCICCLCLISCLLWARHMALYLAQGGQAAQYLVACHSMWPPVLTARDISVRQISDDRVSKQARDLVHCTGNSCCHPKSIPAVHCILALAARQLCSAPGSRSPSSAQCNTAGMRSVCGEEEETTFNHLLQCDGCRSFVHMACYGVAAPPEGRLWLCDLCKLGASCTSQTMTFSEHQDTHMYWCDTMYIEYAWEHPFAPLTQRLRLHTPLLFCTMEQLRQRLARHPQRRRLCSAAAGLTCVHLLPVAQGLRGCRRARCAPSAAA